MASGISKKPGIPQARPKGITNELWYYINALKEIVESYEGVRGQNKDKIVTNRDLEKLGFNLKALTAKTNYYEQRHNRLNTVTGGRNTIYANLHIDEGDEASATAFASSGTSFDGTTTLIVNTGGDSDGSYTDTASDDGVYHVLRETGGGSPGTMVEYTFGGMVKEPAQLIFHGYYNGGHVNSFDIDILGSGGTSADWVTLTTLQTSQSSDETLVIPIPATDTYLHSGAAYLRFHHVDSGNQDHYLYIDHLELTQYTSYTFTEVNTYARVTGLEYDGLSNRINVDQTNSSYITQDDGVYEIGINSSFSCVDSALVEVAIFVDEEENRHIAFHRTVTADSVGNAGVVGQIALTKGAEVSMRVKTDTATTFYIYHLNFNIKKID